MSARWVSQPSYYHRGTWNASFFGIETNNVEESPCDPIAYQAGSFGAKLCIRVSWEPVLKWGPIVSYNASSYMGLHGHYTYGSSVRLLKYRNIHRYTIIPKRPNNTLQGDFISNVMKTFSHINTNSVIKTSLLYFS